MTTKAADTNHIRATEPNPGSNSVSLEQANQKTLPSLPLKRSFPRAELGDSGTRMLHGIITEEYNPQLQGVQGIRVYDEMRKSDGTVRAALLACTLPIQRAEWFVNPASDSEEDKEIANVVEHILFDWMDITWDDFLRQALLMIPFGVMLFEKVYGTKEHEGKTYVAIEKMAPRLPKSILQWELPDRTFGIQQIRQDGVLAMIPGAKLVIFVNEREGDNWWGNSMIRPAYKHWYYKVNFYKIDALAFERQGLGVPVIEMPQGYTDADEKQAQKAAQNLRSNEDAFMLLPPQYKAYFMDMGSHTTRDPEKSINHHNKEILQSVLAQFLELGSTKTGSGSHALSQDHSDLFLKAMESIANNFLSEVNKNLVKEIVDLNFNDVKNYPVVDYSGISKVDMQALGTAYSQLVTAGAITPTDDDQQYLRAAMGLPPRSQEDIEQAAEDERSMESQLDHVDIEEDGEADPKPTDANNKQVDDATGNANNSKTKKGKPGDKKPSDKKKVTAHDHTFLPRRFSDGKGFNAWRELTFAEEKINWAKIEETMDAMESEFTKAALDLLGKAKDQFMAKLHEAMTVNDQKEISALEIKFISEYKAILKDAMKKAYEYGKNNAALEIGVDSPPNTAESLLNIDLMAATIATRTMTQIETAAKLTAANAMKSNESVLQAAGKIDAGMEEAISNAVDNTAPILVGQAINDGRGDVFDRNRDIIYGIQRSELLDAKTCNFCLSMDSWVVEKDDPIVDQGVFHTNCRGIWVAILIDEVNPPEITGIPSDITDHYGGQPNDLVQPTKPMPKPGSLAEKEANRQAAAKTAKAKKK